MDKDLLTPFKSISLSKALPPITLGGGGEGDNSFTIPHVVILLKHRKFLAMHLNYKLLNRKNWYMLYICS